MQELFFAERFEPPQQVAITHAQLLGNVREPFAKYAALRVLQNVGTESRLKRTQNDARGVGDALIELLRESLTQPKHEREVAEQHRRVDVQRQADARDRRDRLHGGNRLQPPHQQFDVPKRAL
ncbi:hypothetical protein SDC9_189366 [bioreactor metagenome]|uniref:Uncharacterized protein n=1 Tax=bioreactor metagenome TaxID=1076179 RepID=A0A645HRZ1_9ZZZZ